jgi:predicted nuclease with RNAse H fold
VAAPALRPIVHAERRTGVGIDVGASRLHAVALRDGVHVVATAVLEPSGASVVEWIGSLGRDAAVRRVAVDAPSALSPGAHADDVALAPKFRAARCGEVALGRDAGVWVPWVSPPEGATDVAPWIRVGLDVFGALSAAGLDVVETFPHAVFRALAGGVRVAAKSTPAGLAQRVELLAGAGLVDSTLPMWGHDGLDAAACALVAADPSARSLGCGHDGSAIWLPG